MKKTLLVAALAAVVTTAANAEGMYVGVGVGTSRAASQGDLDNFNRGMVGALGGSITSTMDKNVNNIRLIGGMDLNENVAVEIGYMRTTTSALNFSGRSGGGVNYSGNAQAKLSGFDVAAVVRPSVDSGFNNVFATVGVHNYTTKFNSTISAGNVSIAGSSKDSGSGTMFGFGYDYDLGEGYDLRLAAIRLQKVSGVSDADTTNYSIGLIKRF